MIQLNRRSLSTGTLGLALLAASAPARALASSPRGVSIDPYANVDPDLLAMAKMLPRSDLGLQTLSAARSASERAPRLPAPAPQPLERSIRGPAGVPLRVYVTDALPGEKGRGAVLHLHGGGFAGGTALAEAALAQTIAQQLGCPVVSVDYSLAPEVKFPESLEQNYAALGWMHSNAGALGIDPGRIGLFGISAGGGHCAALSIAARDRGEFQLACLVMNYPMLDDRTGSTREVPQHLGNIVWTRKSNVFGWSSLLGKPAGSREVPAGSVPARVADLAGLPPTYIGCGGLDLFVQEDIEYAGRLTAAGVPVELLIVPGAYHAFDLIVPQAAVSRRFRVAWIAALKRGLATSAPSNSKA